MLIRGALVVVGDRDAAALRNAVAELSCTGAVLGYPLDVADGDSFAQFLSLARSGSDGGIHVLIKAARFVGPVVSMLGARGRRWFNRRIGSALGVEER